MHCFVPAPSDQDTDPCPLWFILQEIAGDNTTVECVCDLPTEGIICDPKTCNTSLHIRHCMAYNPVTRMPVVGFCIFETKSKSITALPPNVSELNNCRAQRSGARLGNRDVAPVARCSLGPENVKCMSRFGPQDPPASLAHVIFISYWACVNT